jgi:hypothetical protein
VDFPASTLRRVIRAGMARALSHPEETRFLLHQTFRPTPEARKLQQDWEERHVQRTFDYLPQPVTPPRTPREARVRHAAHLLASRVITYTTIVAQESRLAGGPLADLPMPAIVTAVEDLCVRVVSAAGDSTALPSATPGRGAVRKSPPSLVMLPGADEVLETGTAGKAPAKQAPVRKAAMKQTAAKKASAKKTAAKQAAAKQTPVNKTAAKPATAKQAAAQKGAVKSVPVTKAAGTKTAAAKAPVTKAPVTKAAAQKAAANPVVPKKAVAKKAATRKPPAQSR